MTQTEKNVKVLKKWLKENGLSYEVGIIVNGMEVDVYIPKVKIAVCIGDSQVFFDTMKKDYAPFFIRESESEEKTTEKITNCCIWQMRKIHQKYSSLKRRKQ